MNKHTLPKAIRAAVNRNAFRIAMTDGYEGLRIDLERLAQSLMNQSHATVGEVVAALDGNNITQTSAHPVQHRQ